MKSGQVGYQSKGLTLRSNLKLESSFCLILVKSYGHNICTNVCKSRTLLHMVMFRAHYLTAFQLHPPE